MATFFVCIPFMRWRSLEGRIARESVKVQKVEEFRAKGKETANLTCQKIHENRLKSHLEPIQFKMRILIELILPKIGALRLGKV